ncbi:glycosyltransferase [Candidatus Saccharibacteria bacterium]|nr:glycosyltransferase [Candidatus Saccharibacteria bacterium]
MGLVDFGKNMAGGIKSLWVKYHFLVPPRLWKKYAKTFVRIITGKVGAGSFLDPFRKEDYNYWLKKNTKDEIYSDNFDYRPLISIIMPVYNVKAKYFRECIESILAQQYKNYEICIVDDASTLMETKKVFEEYEENEHITIVRHKKNEHISRTMNDAIKIAKGDYVAFVDDDDVLAKDALFEVVKALNGHKNADIIYSDEDKINVGGVYCDPHFKPDYSPDTLLSMNYICHLLIMRTSLVKELGGFRAGVEGAQDYDLILRATEKTNKIYHIPKILYHWRMSKQSTAMNVENKDYARDIGMTVIEEALKRRGINARVEKDEASTSYRVVYELKKQPLVSILIPTKDYAETLETCLKSIYEKTTYKNYEIIVINNNSEEAETFDLFDKYKKKYKNFSVLDANIPFNYSKLNNMAAKKAKGEVLVLLNNDTEIITPEWLEILVGYAVQSHIGAVGPKLLYPDNTVQHAGVIMGLGGVASHAYIGAARDEVGAYGRLRVPYNYAAVTGACLVVEKKKFEKVGGLEEKLTVAYNDIDFCMKLLGAGYVNVEVPMVELCHFESKSRGLDTAPEKKKRFDEEQDFMYKKWPEMIANDPYYNPNFSKRGWFMLDKEKQ